MQKISSIRISLTILFLLSISIRAKAQAEYRYEAGGGIGLSGYLGDGDGINPYRTPGSSAEVLFRYVPNARFGWKTALYLGSIKGKAAGTVNNNNAKTVNFIPEIQNYRFSTRFFEMSEAFEFNFCNYGIGETYKQLHRITPYLNIGGGLTLYNNDNSTRATFIIPIGLGIKYKLAERWNLGFEFLLKKTFTDRLDGLKLSDPYHIDESWLKNKDWYATSMITISYEFSERCAACNYKE